MTEYNVDDVLDMDNYSINQKANTLYAAMYDAYEKFNQVAKRGAPNLLAPVIEHKTLPSDTPLYEHQPLTKDNSNGDLNDDIPF